MTALESLTVYFPLWIAVVGFLFSLCFGWDVVQYFRRAKRTQWIEERKAQRKTQQDAEWDESHPADERARRGERELVVH